MPNSMSESCKIKVGGQHLFLLSSNPAMPEEELLALGLVIPNSWQVVGSRLTGESMYMGSIPVVWRAESNTERGQWATDVRLGACVLPDMQWRLSIEFDTPDGPEALAVVFTASN
ncbi:MAG: hypothetical protein JJU10_05100 [Idiomarina sp.]|nr:hypothetical protein [Idiomarina sp.]